MLRQRFKPAISYWSKPTSSRNVASTIIRWWLFPAHLALAAVLVIVLQHSLQGKQFAVSQEGGQDLNVNFQLAQPDVIALVSTVLTLVRALAGAAVTLIGWRMAFLTLGTKGATLAQVDYMVSWRRPPIKGQIALWLVFLLSVPSQFTAPVLQGAINWIPDTRYKLDGSRDVTTPGPSDYWDWTNMFTNNRYYDVMQAVGIASLASSKNFKPFNNSDSIPSIPSRRLVPSLLGENINSSVSNISLPFFQAHSLRWAQTADDIGADMGLLDSVISNGSAPALSFSDRITIDEEEPNLFRIGTDPARLVLVNERKWQAQPKDDTGKYQWPQSQVHHSANWVIVALTYNANCSTYFATFGIVNDIYLHDSEESCFIFAKLNYTAGVLSCKDCKIVADGVVEAPTNYTGNQTVLPDSLAGTAISMIPEVLFYTKIANSSLAPTWNNLNGYTVGTLATAYQASWNSLANRFAQDSMDSTELSVPVEVLRALITSWRIWLWLGLNACLTVSALILACLQQHLRADVMRYPALTALLVDSRSVFEQRTEGFSDVGSLTKHDLSTPLRLENKGRALGLVVDDTNVSRRSHRHEQYTRPTIQDDATSELELVSEQSYLSQARKMKKTTVPVSSVQSLSSARDY